MWIALCRLGLLIAWSSILCIGAIAGQDKKEQSIAHIVLVSVFAFGRVAHTIVYWLEMSALRSTAWALALAAVVAMSINTVVAAFRAT